ncbi:MAG: IS110 family transposase, partial [Burkholderiales bacterium]
VAKDEVVFACADASFAVRGVKNQRADLLAFLKNLPAGSRIGLESTGIYHELLANLAYKLGFVVYVLNPKDARNYAKAIGLRGKTDRVDSEMLARMISREYEKLHAWVPPTPEQREIGQLLNRRAKLSSLRQSLGQTLTGVDGFNADLKSMRKRFDQLLARIDARVKELNELDPKRKEHVQHMLTLDGVGKVVAPSLVNALERLPLKSADAFVAFTGLDPRPDESGRYRGKRRLSKRGPSELRRLLYVAAMSARKTKTWKPIYEHYRAKGLSSTASLVVIARRLARVAWSMYTNNTPFDPTRIKNALT